MQGLVAIVLMSFSLSLFSQEKELKTFFDNSAVKSEYIYSDANNYKVTNYFENGNVKEIGEFANGKMHGSWLSFTKEGIKAGEASYNNGLKQGEWKIYDQSGNMRYTINYENGRIMNATNYDSNGKLVAETHSR